MNVFGGICRGLGVCKGYCNIRVMLGGGVGCSGSFLVMLVLDELLGMWG